jgi:hypothetical protein
MNESKPQNLAIRVSSDPTLIKFLMRLKEPQYRIPIEYEEEIKKLRGIGLADKGVLVSKVTTPEDYQDQLKLLSAVQNCLDHIHELNLNLYIIQSKYKELFNLATRVITLGYFDELNELKDGVRKVVVQVALQPIQEGIDKLETLVALGESTNKHLTAVNFNIKEGTSIIREYLSLFKFGSSVRLPPTDKDLEV